MLNVFIFTSFIFAFTFGLGKILEKFRIPWLFAALILGGLLAFNNPLTSVINHPSFTFISQLGMYFLLFIIGLEVNLNQIKKQGRFIVENSLFIIFFEGLIGGILIHLIFQYHWLISFLVALSFATVGEAILIPILDQFNLVNTKLGQLIIGIGTIDDLIEITLLILISIFIGRTDPEKILIVLISLAILFSLTVFFSRLKEEGKKFQFGNIETLTLFSLFTLFLFIGIGQYAKSAPLAALLAGLSLKTFLPPSRLKSIEKEIKAITYGFFAPLFFFQVGAAIKLTYLLNYPLLIILIVIVSNGSKILASLITSSKKLGIKQSLLLGIGLSVRFSTSIIIIKILFDQQIIRADLYSIIIASSIAFQFIIPLLFAQLITKWVKTNKNP